MADNPYSGPTISGYNASPPADDGSLVDANEVEWAKHLTKIGNPLKTFAEAISTAVSTAFSSTINTGDDQQNSMTGSLAFGSSELTIATGAITPTRSHHTVDTESDAATDDLDTINTTSISEGGVVILRAANAGRTVVVKHGTGNITTQDGLDYSIDDATKRMVLMREGANFVELTRSFAQQGVVSRGYAEVTTVQTSSTVIPNDDTIPQNTEGSELMTLAYTPQATTNRLRIEFQCSAQVSTTTGRAATAGLFQDSTASALAADTAITASTSDLKTIKIVHEMDAGTTSSTTFKIRFGPSGDTMTINGTGGTRQLGGAMKATLTITEYLP